ncbi:hypothetical protein [uncultured Pluralibacter sp.]|uniref:hypothetical protein n=1 Tax=uncultured Pluralibacter sp. TaxID=1490864 RepID=UPI00261B21D2|nr:hypothetical protein [uncultured Pluralibacter sp.]
MFDVSHFMARKLNTLCADTQKQRLAEAFFHAAERIPAMKVTKFADSLSASLAAAGDTRLRPQHRL